MYVTSKLVTVQEISCHVSTHASIHTTHHTEEACEGMVPTKEAREEIEESGTHRTERARGLWRGRGVAAHGSAPYL